MRKRLRNRQLSHILTHSLTLTTLETIYSFINMDHKNIHR